LLSRLNKKDQRRESPTKGTVPSRSGLNLPIRFGRRQVSLVGS